MPVIDSLERALEAIEQYSGATADFELHLSSEVLDDMGLNMAIITDKILSKGWMPGGVKDEDGYKTFRYAELRAKPYTSA